MNANLGHINQIKDIEKVGLKDRHSIFSSFDVIFIPLDRIILMHFCFLIKIVILYK